MGLLELKRSVTRIRVPEVLGLDLGASGIKIIRAKKGKEGPAVTAVGVLPAFSPGAASGQEGEPARLELPKEWGCRYAAVAVTGENAAIRYVSLPGKAEAHPDINSELREHMGLEGEYRLAYAVAGYGKKKDAETRLLTAALPEEEVANVLACVEIGTPAAFAIEIASLAALNAFSMHGPAAKRPEEALGFIECGARVTLLALFNKGSLCLVRKFNLGGENLVARIQKQMDVAREVAQGIVSDGSFDISQAITDVIDPFLRQLTISKDFVERREGCHISAFYVSGGMSLSRYWVERIRATAGVDVAPWNPFEGLDLAGDALPKELSGQEPRFAAALGAAAGALESA
ncbi:MAG: pilus assembly protein PilM [Kiritimatiellae bacterium]|nr:pilus assembly protein PilM [Kiritimatiellia bacterium]